jgi:predicted RNase H-like nuclease
MLVLGIDAAWTPRQPSGVALVSKHDDRWRLLAAAPSYEAFQLGARRRSKVAADRPAGGLADAGQLLLAAELLANAAVDVVAIDMPLARSPIISRRPADDAVSRAYGARKCSTHTPNPIRPGSVSDNLRIGFEERGLSLCTSGKLHRPGLIEVYPHPALVELAQAGERLPYKQSKMRAYWPDLPPAARRERLLEQWSGIVALLDREIGGVADALKAPPLSAAVWELKAFEDTLDAVVCAWVGACALEGLCIPYGDAEAAIWIPRAGSAICPIADAAVSLEGA